ncbi:MAG: hypothetical protein JSV04_12535, partial [Candidatus Heimdallarchaeota archaeon]
PTNKSHPILVYCKSGGRSRTASTTLVLLSYSQVFNMLGGFDAWKDVHYPYETGAYIIQTNGNFTSTSTTAGSIIIPAVNVLFVFQAICFIVILTKQRQE